MTGGARWVFEKENHQKVTPGFRVLLRFVQKKPLLDDKSYDNQSTKTTCKRFWTLIFLVKTENYCKEWDIHSWSPSFSCKRSPETHTRSPSVPWIPTCTLDPPSVPWNPNCTLNPTYLDPQVHFGSPSVPWTPKCTLDPKLYLAPIDITTLFDITDFGYLQQTIDNGRELDRKLKTMLQNRKRCLHNLLW